ncbi:class I SAM-dependent methyltransferase [bacterium]|nr:class I SAM-dependent methyltransferase [bacterium]MBU1984050.1 class I SAM-dependent methyltransferase [bacterium]
MIDRLMRYGAVARLLGPAPDGTILDVGAGPEGLGACLPYRFVGVDPWYPEPPIPTQQAIRASATALPFAAESFDHVLCIEVLEHLSPDIRPRVVAEMCRVARRQIIITHPYGRLTRCTDHLMRFFFALLRVFGKSRPWWLMEHLQNPYPDPRLYLPSPSSQWSIRSEGQENVFLRPVVAIFGNVRRVSRYFKRLHERRPAIARRLVRLFNFPPYSRKVIVLRRIETGTG